MFINSDLITPTSDIFPFRDTVSSIGFSRGPPLPHTTGSPKHICVFRHALALDERRVKFLPEYVNGGSSLLGDDDHRRVNDLVLNSSGSGTKPDETGPYVIEDNVEPPNPELSKDLGGMEPVKEVWFAGSHSDM